MAKLYSFIPNYGGKKKNLNEFFSNFNGLSKSVHVGYMVAIKGKRDMLEMHFVCSNNTATFKRAYAWRRFPEGEVVIEEAGKKYMPQE